jgi:hypothetical protein
MANIFLEAVVKQLARTVTPSPMSAAQWAEIPTAIRERSLFSAKVTNTRHLQTLKDSIDMILAPRTERNEDGTLVTRGMDVPTARVQIKDLLDRMGYDPGAKEGTIEDLSSDQRINLQLTQNVESAQGFGNFVQGTAPGVIDAYPAQELFRAEDREEPRDWPQRWQEAGGVMYGDRMIALKSSPVWEAISAFGVPWPPFDYGSGMWVRDVDRDEAEALGLISPQEQAVAPQSSFKLQGVEEPKLE